MELAKMNILLIFNTLEKELLETKLLYLKSK